MPVKVNKCAIVFASIIALGLLKLFVDKSTNDMARLKNNAAAKNSAKKVKKLFQLILISFIFINFTTAKLIKNYANREV